MLGKNFYWIKQELTWNKTGALMGEKIREVIEAQQGKPQKKQRKALRKVSECPVIMLTVFGSTEDIVKGFELGADDYLVKPFGIRELTARVSMLLRRTSPVL